jgi:hypothetical protein
MFTILFIVLFIWIFGGLIKLSFRAAWGLTKLLCVFLFLPILLIGLVIGGLIYVALPLLLIAGLVALLARS